jgi:hypothetical protein
MIIAMYSSNYYLFFFVNMLVIIFSQHKTSKKIYCIQQLQDPAWAKVKWKGKCGGFTLAYPSLHVQITSPIVRPLCRTCT